MSDVGCDRPTPRAPVDQSRTVAQLSGPDLVPKELAEALLAGRGWPDAAVPELVPQRLPANLPFDVPLPEGARVVGGLTQRSSGTLVFAVPQKPVDAVRAYERVLNSNGWRAPDVRHGAGFRPPDIVSASYCQGGRRSVSLSGVERREGGTFLRVHYAARERPSLCDESIRGDHSIPRGPVPTFYSPEGTSVIDGSTGGGRSYMEAHARLKTALRPAQLIAHYGAQARAEGWSLQSESLQSDMGAQTWQLRDRDGKVWIGLLLARAIPGADDREVIFRVIPQAIDGRS